MTGEKLARIMRKLESDLCIRPEIEQVPIVSRFLFLVLFLSYPLISFLSVRRLVRVKKHHIRQEGPFTCDARCS